MYLHQAFASVVEGIKSNGATVDLFGSSLVHLDVDAVVRLYGGITHYLFGQGGLAGVGGINHSSFVCYFVRGQG